MKKQFKMYRPSAATLATIGTKTSDKEFCFEALKKVSRSFSVVIHQLPEKLQAPVGLFYLVLRGLDTIEDDMSIPADQKSLLLKNFASRINTEEFTLSNIGDTQDYRDLMANFDKVVRQYQLLDSPYKNTITDITNRMAFGMNKYAQTKVNSYADWDDYCHYVAGLVGIGLSKIFTASRIESSAQLEDEFLSNQMGLFLQKTNIIRDFAEDLTQERLFWPSEAWENKVEKIVDLQNNKKVGVEVVNELVENALTHIPYCLKYLKVIHNEKVLRFCAIPQLMAAATLQKLYNNDKVLTENVKIRRGKTARFFMSKQNYNNIKAEFIKVLDAIYSINKRENVALIITEIKQFNEGE
jgi:farnesyl-diphosphate farnesyltransferase